MKSKRLRKILSQQIINLSNLFKDDLKLYIVGGALRDYFLNKIPNDFDFTTKAKPNQILEILKNYQTFQIGEKYGTIGVLFEGVKYEITTFRSDGIYLNNRHPNNVIFKNNIIEDLKRRDFTINALAYDICENKIIDEFNGIKDLKNKIIDCIGEPKDRFSEDALRIFRAFSFCSKLDFDISQKTIKAIKDRKELLKNIKIERIRAEIIKILEGKNLKKALLLIRENEILDIKNIPKNINKIPKELRIYASFLIFNVEKYFSTYLTKKISIIENIDKSFKKSNKLNCKQRKIILTNLALKFGIENVEKNLIIKSKLNKKMRIFKKVFNKREISNKINLKINGNDIANFGFKQKEIQYIKDEFIQNIIKGNFVNNRKFLLKTLKNYQIKL